MHLSDFKEIVSVLAVVSAVIQLLSGVPVCQKYVNNKTTAETSPLPFICGMMCCYLWLLYGIVIEDNVQNLVNTIGIILMAGYTIVFYNYTFKKSAVIKPMLVTVVCISVMTVYTIVEEDNNLLKDRLGVIAVSFTIVTIVAPMSKLLHVCKVKSTECLPFPMILMTFVVSALWALYGIIAEDAYLVKPNLVGAILALAQLGLFVIYPNKPPSQSLLKSMVA